MLEHSNIPFVVKRKITELLFVAVDELFRVPQHDNSS